MQYYVLFSAITLVLFNMYNVSINIYFHLSFTGRFSSFEITKFLVWLYITIVITVQGVINRVHNVQMYAKEFVVFCGFGHIYWRNL